VVYKHVVCIVDGSKESEKAETRAAEIARDNGAELTYLFLEDTGFLSRRAPLTKGGGSLERGMDNIGRLLLGKAGERARKVGIPCREEILKGNETKMLIEKLPEMKADLLVASIAHAGLLFDIDRNDLDTKIEEIREKTGVDTLLF